MGKGIRFDKGYSDPLILHEAWYRLTELVFPHVDVRVRRRRHGRKRSVSRAFVARSVGRCGSHSKLVSRRISSQRRPTNRRDRLRSPEVEGSGGFAKLPCQRNVSPSDPGENFSCSLARPPPELLACRRRKVRACNACTLHSLKNLSV